MRNCTCHCNDSKKRFARRPLVMFFLLSLQCRVQLRMVTVLGVWLGARSAFLVMSQQ